ncbi:PHP domain-containing protein [Micromonospora sp. NBC_01813]|uniref:PHP domain-containing protein n=1 Tax=Micromonospora sp. NBC_01813 TaxID=2975988 RepID=UPI002DDC20A4|nr:PHP domain-containing protein [Micromonospora sp. NBC_01813]WSA09756.1 PHP domain-containing protein [Micromonospora sp. NBC_01813]
MRIDLHTHSTVSDGTATPTQVVDAAAGAGMDVIALTDHDSSTGWTEAATALPPGLTLVPGAELSCACYIDGQRLGMHMLAYLFDPNHAGLSAAMAEVRDGLAARAQAMVDLLRAGGEDITWEEVRELAAGDTVGRPHIAQALVNRGRIDSTAEAFQPAWLGERYYLPKPASMKVFDALRLVREAGGVAVLAHPRRKGRIVPREILARLAEEGLFGVEADHPEHDDAARKDVRALAAELNLVVTGSSDFHGTRKPSLIGDNTTDPQVYEQIVEAATGAAPITTTTSTGTVRR